LGTTAALTLISLLGNRIEQIYKIRKDGSPIPDWLAQLKESPTQMKKSFTTFLMTLSHLPGLWNSPLFVEVVRTRRPWYGSRNPNTSAYSTELDELEGVGNLVESYDEII